jgi:phenylacetate-CoA ligase
MPMIRYQIGDRAAWSEKLICKCGRGYPLLARIEGRSLDVIKTPVNLKLGGTFWTLLFRSKPGIKQFQVVQNNIKGISVYFVPEKNFKKLTLKHFANKIKEKCGNDFEVVFVQKESLEKTASGKHRIVISKC